ncbi:MAG: hypothetical protein GY854_27505 [Deltaproteobacteria bacterium]|nr:hypothetical protein [Deltaproteobacteria bacterium]
MTNSAKRNRQSIRLRGYDYAQAGAYFVTICVRDRLCLFGNIVDDQMVLNDAGAMVEKWWGKMPEKYETVDVDTHVVMPNHFHGIIVISYNAFPKPDRVDENDTGKGENMVSPLRTGNECNTPSRFVGAIPCNRPELDNRVDENPDENDMGKGENMVSPLRMGNECDLGRFVSWFKRMATNEYIRGVKQHGWARFPGRLWQRNYYDRIIRNENELNRIREYIIHNPAGWDNDDYNPIFTE